MPNTQVPTDSDFSGPQNLEFKGKVALEALKGLKTVNELAGQYQLHPTQISQWKRQVQRGAKNLFASAKGKGQDHEATQAKLYEEV